MKTYILLLAGFSLNFIACSKTTDSKKDEVKKFLKLKKITGPTFYDENFLSISFNDSALYFYNENQRVSKIIYYSTYANPNNVTGKVSVEENYTYDSKGRISEITRSHLKNRMIGYKNRHKILGRNWKRGYDKGILFNATGMGTNRACNTKSKTT